MVIPCRVVVSRLVGFVRISLGHWCLRRLVGASMMEIRLASTAFGAGVTLRCFTNGTIAQVVTNRLSPLSGQHLYDGSRVTVQFRRIRTGADGKIH